jgi:hypothetical protein
VQWTTDGVMICGAAYNQIYPVIAPDGAGGAIMTWEDVRNGSYKDVYAQRINGSGAVQWTTDGVAVCAAALHQDKVRIAADGAGGAVLTWQDLRNGPNFDIYAQRIDAAGIAQWTVDGVALCTLTGYQVNPSIISDGSGGAFVTWSDYRGADYDIYSQRVNGSGAVQWTAGGVATCLVQNEQGFPVLVTDGAGGAIIAWHDFRNLADYDIYAQRVDASGNMQWTANGVVISSATNFQQTPNVVPDGSGGAIIAWSDKRSGSAYDIYAQNVTATGSIGNVLGTNGPVTNNQPVVFPNPGNGELIIRSATGGYYTLVNEAGQTVRAFELNAGNNCSMRIEGLAGGIYFLVGYSGDQSSTQKIVVIK